MWMNEPSWQKKGTEDGNKKLVHVQKMVAATVIYCCLYLLRKHKDKFPAHSDGLLC